MFSGNAHFLFVAQGSSGDILPPLAVARELRRRGNDVSFVTHTHFGELIRRHELDFIDLQDEEHYRMLHGPDYWDPHKSLKQNASFLTDGIKKQYELVAHCSEPGRTVAVASVNGMGVRIAHEKLGLPMISAHICPYLLRSLDAPSDMQIHNFLPYFRRWDPTGLANRIYFRMADLLFYDPLFRGPVNRLRSELGLPPVSHVFRQWLQSPQLIVGLFPTWFVNPYPRDWPAHTVLTDFPLEDDRDGMEIPSAVLDFLATGEAPIVFCPGTGMAHARDFFTKAVETCTRLRRRGLLLTRFPELVPEDLPDFVHHAPYVPFSKLLPHAAALVSHAGIGSVSQALKAGIPQLLMPMNFDQPDNARRLTEFGVARTVNWKKTCGREMAKELEFLLRSPEVQNNCRLVQKQFSSVNPVQRACDVMEEFAARALAGRQPEALLQR
jgi:UDP:flavonoid glycosyltransferase YjiC (YdhE family)